MKQLQKKIKSGTLDLKKDDPFELFISATNIRYCYYAETHKILGNTYGMCVLQVRTSEDCITVFFLTLTAVRYRGFISVFSRRTTGFHRSAKLFDLNLFIRKTFH